MNFSIILFVIVLLSGCSSPTLINSRTDSSAINNSVLLNKPNSVPGKLYQHYLQWKGTPYQLGGLSKSGIDCSGYVQLAYQEQFSYSLPRTTEYQAKIGQAVKRHRLLAGDLVFFKTAYKVRHVGIYLGNEHFLHASSSKGVMISRLNDSYWKNTFWQARRVNLINP